MPTSSNSWTLSWTGDPAATAYELQEAHNADFSDAQAIDVGAATSVTLTRGPVKKNVYYLSLIHISEPTRPY